MSKPNTKKRSKVTEMPKREDTATRAGTPPDPAQPVFDFSALFGRREEKFNRVANDDHKHGFLLIPYTSGYRTFVDPNSGEVAIVLKTSQYFDKGFTASSSEHYHFEALGALPVLFAKGEAFIAGLQKSTLEHAIRAKDERFEDMVRDPQRQPKVDANDVRVYKRVTVPNPAGTASVT